jgi:predicted acetyltransferase
VVEGCGGVGDIHQDGAGIHEADELGTVEGFGAWISRLREQSDESVAVGPDRVHASYWWIVEDGEYAGAISLRHRLNDQLLDAGGHIGYGVRPSYRRRGLASWALGEVLTKARERGLERVLVSCAAENLASARTIERNGGVLEDIRETWLGLARRYWIEL